MLSTSNLKIEQDHIYYDVSVVNNRVNTQQPQDLRFSEIRNQPFLQEPDLYYVSVLRFSVNTISLPVMIPIVEIGQSNPNLLTYSLTLQYEYLSVKYNAKVNLVFNPENINTPTPAQPLTSQDLSTEYYYLNSLSHFVQMINDAFATSLTTLDGLVVGAGGTLPSALPPILELDPYTSTTILNADVLGFDDKTADHIKIFFNVPLYNLLSSYWAENYGFNQADGLDYNIRCFDNGQNTITVGTGLNTINYIQMYQEYETLRTQANPVKSVVFTSALLPINPSLVSTSQPFNSNTSLLNTGNNSNIGNVLTDFEIQDGLYKSSILYVPSAEYRLIDLIGNKPLNSLELSVFWRDAYNNLYPLKLANGSTADVKLLFRRKDFNNKN